MVIGASSNVFADGGLFGAEPALPSLPIQLLAWQHPLLGRHLPTQGGTAMQ
jgi:hypothetical protein